MAVYVFNLLVGYLPNGIDNAQGYRAQMLKEFEKNVWHIFTELPGKREFDIYRKAGIDVEQMLSLHQYFTDNHTLKALVKTEDKLQELKKSLEYTSVEYKKHEIRLFKDGLVIASILLDEYNKEYFYCIYFFKDKKLFRMEAYADNLFYVDYYTTSKNDDGIYAKLTRRTFYNTDGTVSFEQLFEEEKERYFFPDGRIYTKSELIVEFIKRLHLSKRDTIILDRSSQFDFVQPVFEYGTKARFVVVFHSEHFFEKGEDPYAANLNYEYSYWFKYSNIINTMIVSTQEQKEKLIRKLQEYNCSVPDVRVIPAGRIEYLRYPVSERKSCSLISVSRLDPRKKIDYIIKGVIKAHQVNPNISLDIFGRGVKWYTEYLEKIVSDNQAQSYIRFMGQADVMEIYKHYEVFVTASTWETLGLSVMEAIGSGAAVIGLDVKYGNRLFIHPEVNGYLIDYNYIDADDNKIVNDMAEKIIEIFSNKERLEVFHKNSYKIAMKFTSKIVAEKWKELLS